MDLQVTRFAKLGRSKIYARNRRETAKERRQRSNFVRYFYTWLIRESENAGSEKKLSITACSLLMFFVECIIMQGVNLFALYGHWEGFVQSKDELNGQGMMQPANPNRIVEAIRGINK